MLRHRSGLLRVEHVLRRSRIVLPGGGGVVEYEVAAASRDVVARRGTAARTVGTGANPAAGLLANLPAALLNVNPCPWLGPPAGEHRPRTLACADLLQGGPGLRAGRELCRQDLPSRVDGLVLNGSACGRAHPTGPSPRRTPSGTGRRPGTSSASVPPGPAPRRGAGRPGSPRPLRRAGRPELATQHPKVEAWAAARLPDGLPPFRLSREHAGEPVVGDPAGVKDNRPGTRRALHPSSLRRGCSARVADRWPSATPEAG